MWKSVFTGENENDRRRQGHVEKLIPGVKVIRQSKQAFRPPSRAVWQKGSLLIPEVHRLEEKLKNMNSFIKKSSIILLAGLLLFSLFWWLLSMGMPEGAKEFAIGITIIIITGILSGRYISRIWKRKNIGFQNFLLFLLSALILLGIVGIALLINQMIAHTEFFHFSLTVLLLFLLSAFAGVIISLLNHRIRSEIQKARTDSAHSKSELQLLQSQLSPHFLFNTLNNLYGLSITDHEKVPALLLKLSELLRYSVYDTKEVFVPLGEEVKYLKNYIDFETIRLGDRLDLKVDFPDPADLNARIAPMLLIIFVENAFKHSGNSYDEKIYVKIDLQLQDQHLRFRVDNSYQKPAPESAGFRKHSGFGLENVKKRLDLLYKEEHELEIEQSEKEFKVDLILKSK